MKKLFLSIIIPCYNEEENLLRGVLAEVHEYLRSVDYTYEVIISDDGSTDESKSVVSDQIKNWKKFRILENHHGGKPYALWCGIQAAKGEYVLFTDMDQSTPIKELNKLVPKLKEDNDVVIGSRGMSRKDFPIYRRIGAVAFLIIRRLMVLWKVRDTQCGFKLFKTELVEKAFPKLEFFQVKKQVKGWTVTSYDVELLHILNKMGAKISEVRVKWNDRDYSTSKGGKKGRYVKESKDMLKQIIRIKRNDLKGYYNLRE